MMSADPLTLLGAFLPDAPENMTPGQLTMQLLDVNPAVGYGPGGLYEKAPEKVSENSIVNAAHNLGRIFQAGSGAEGVLGGAGSVVAQALGDLPAASDAMGVFLPPAFASTKQLQKLPQYETETAARLGKATNANQYAREIQDLWYEFGWDRPNIDLTPRMEIPIRDTEIVASALMNAKPGKSTVDYMGNIWAAPRLYERVPQLRNTPVQINWGQYDEARPMGGGLYTRPQQPGAARELQSIKLDAPINATDQDIISTLGHESTHAVDWLAGLTGLDVPGFSDVGNTSKIGELLNDPRYDSYAYYLRLGNETAARNVEGRYRAGHVLPRDERRSMQLYPEYLHPLVTDSNLAHFAPSISNPVPIEEQIRGYWLYDPLEGLTPRQRKPLVRPLR